MTSPLPDEYRRYLRESGAANLFHDELPDAPARMISTGIFDPTDAEREIRRLEEARGYPTYSAVGTEPRLDWLFRLGTAASRKGPYQGPLLRSHRKALRSRVDDVRRGTQRLGLAWPSVYVNLFPTGELNAMSVPVPGGYLALVNIGLMNLVFSVLKTHVLSQRVGPADEDGALLTESQVELLLAEALNAYIYGGGSWTAWPTPQLPARRNDLITPVLALCEDFVLAHEIGHLLFGDRLEASYISAPLAAPVPGLDIPVADHEAEFAADQMGAEIVRARFVVDESIGPSDERSLYAGLMFFSLLDGAVRAATSQLDASAAECRSGAVITHPHAAERMERLRTTFPPRHDTSLTLVQSFGTWFEHYLPGALGHIEEANQTIIRRAAPWWRTRDDPPGSRLG